MKPPQQCAAVTLSPKCIRFETSDYPTNPNNKRKQGGRNRRPRCITTTTGTGDSQNNNSGKTSVQGQSPVNKSSHPTSHVVAVSAQFAKMNIRDEDIDNSVLPLLESTLIESPCTTHGDVQQKSSNTESCRRLIWLSLDLAENYMSDHGFNKIVAWLMTHVGTIRLRSLKVYRNSIGDSGAIALAELVELSPWPIEEVHFSHNHIGNTGALRFMSAFLNCYQPQVYTDISAPNFKVVAGAPVYPRLDPHRPLYLPVWLRLEYNYIQDTESLLLSLSKELQMQRGIDGRKTAIACFAEKAGLSVKDPNCSPKRCSGATSTNSPLFHLYSFTHQLRPPSPAPELLDGHHQLRTHSKTTAATDGGKGSSSASPGVNEPGSRIASQQGISGKMDQQDHQIRESLTRDGGESGELSNDSMNSPQSENRTFYGKLTATTLSTQGGSNSNNRTTSPILRELHIGNPAGYIAKKSEGDSGSTFQDPQSVKASSSTSTNRDSNMTRASTKAPLDTTASGSRFNLNKQAMPSGQSDGNLHSLEWPNHIKSSLPEFQSHDFGAEGFLHLTGRNICPQEQKETHQSSTIPSRNLLIFPDAQACLALNCEGSRFSWQSLVEWRQKDCCQGDGLKGVTFCLTPSSERLFRKCISPSLFEALKLYGLVRSMGTELPPKCFSSPLEETLSSQVHFSLVPGTYPTDGFFKHLISAEIMKAVEWIMHHQPADAGPLSQILILSDDYGRFADFVHSATRENGSASPARSCDEGLRHSSSSTNLLIYSVDCIRSELSNRSSHRRNNNNKADCSRSAHPHNAEESPQIGPYDDSHTPLFANKSTKNICSIEWFLSLLEKPHAKRNLVGVRSFQSNDPENVSDNSTSNPSTMQGPNGIKFPPVVCTPVVPRWRDLDMEGHDDNGECLATPIPDNSMTMDRSMLRTFSDISNKYFYSESQNNNNNNNNERTDPHAMLLRRGHDGGSVHETVSQSGVNIAGTAGSSVSDSTGPYKSSSNQPLSSQYGPRRELTGDNVQMCSIRAFNESFAAAEGSLLTRNELVQETLVSLSHSLNVLSSLKSSLMSHHYSHEDQKGSSPSMQHRSYIDGPLSRKDLPSATAAETVSRSDVEAVDSCMDILRHLIRKWGGVRSNSVQAGPCMPMFTSSNPCGRNCMQSPNIYLRSQSGSSQQQFMDPLLGGHHHHNHHHQRNLGYESADEAELSRGGPLQMHHHHHHHHHHHRLQQQTHATKGLLTGDRMNARLTNTTQPTPKEHLIKYEDGEEAYACCQVGSSTCDSAAAAAHGSCSATVNEPNGGGGVVPSQSPTYFTQLVSRLNQRLNDSQSNQMVAND